MRGNVILIGGGVKSGKSSFALQRAEELGRRRVFVATAQALDEEMRQRIQRHQQDRGPGYRTVEEPLDLSGVLLSLVDCDVAVVDCLTLWLSNLLGAGLTKDQVLGRMDDLNDALDRLPFVCLFVSNEVGLGLVPQSPLGRIFRDLAGMLHQKLVARSDEVYFSAMGAMLRLKPGPVVLL
jgi:adenosylcobinamide kinase/adenosylcobinamide-phosphate guanylyltransferase